MSEFVHLSPRDIEGSVWLPDGLRVENGIPQGDLAKGGAALLLLSVDDGSPADPLARTVRVLGADGVEHVWEGARVSKGGGRDVTIKTLDTMPFHGIDPDIVVEHDGVEHRFVKTSFCGGAAFGAWLQSCLSGEEVEVYPAPSEELPDLRWVARGSGRRAYGAPDRGRVFLLSVPEGVNRAGAGSIVEMESVVRRAGAYYVRVKNPGGAVREEPLGLMTAMHRFIGGWCLIVSSGGRERTFEAYCHGADDYARALCNPERAENDRAECRAREAADIMKMMEKLKRVIEKDPEACKMDMAAVIADNPISAMAKAKGAKVDKAQARLGVAVKMASMLDGLKGKLGGKWDPAAGYGAMMKDIEDNALRDMPNSIAWTKPDDAGTPLD